MVKNKIKILKKAESMKIHRKPEKKNAGKYDVDSGRYVPISGGSRSRLPVADDDKYRRYAGLVGIDERLSEDIYRVSHLYNHITNPVVIPEGPEGEYLRQVYELIDPEKNSSISLEKDPLEE